ncbi:hypothetical protein HDU96_002129 [Phlyctochytrium bullatum]|nr:hypothetical protein HDU96_002129 [Phlyctochytrium bullatum]
MTNPHLAVLDATLAQIQELFAATDFVPHSESKGTKIWSKTPAGAMLPITRGDAVFPAPFTIPEILAVVRNSNDRKFWSSKYEETEVLEEYSPEEGLMRIVQKAPMPLLSDIAPNSDRDFILAYKVYTTRNATYFIQASVNDPKDPRFAVPKGRVRGTVTAGWILKPSTAEQGATDVTYIVNVDPAGNLPSVMVKMAAVETPACVGVVREVLEQRRQGK